jgi:S-layer protein
MTTQVQYQNGGWIKYPDRVTTRTWFRATDRFTKRVTVKQGNVIRQHSFVESIVGSADSGKVIPHKGLSESVLVNFVALTSGQTIILGGLTFTAGSYGISASALALAWSSIAGDGTGYAAATTAWEAAAVAAVLSIVSGSTTQALTAANVGTYLGTFTAGTLTGWNTFNFYTTNPDYLETFTLGDSLVNTQGQVVTTPVTTAVDFRATSYLTNVLDLGYVTPTAFTAAAAGATLGNVGSTLIGTAATFTAANIIGLPITGPGIPAGTVIVATGTTSTTSIGISNALTTDVSQVSSAYNYYATSLGTGTAPTLNKVDGSTSFAKIAGVTLYDVDATAGDVETVVYVEASFWADALLWAAQPTTDFIYDSLGNPVAVTSYNTGVYGPDAATTQRLMKQFVEQSNFEELGFITAGEVTGGTTYYV